MKVGRQIRRQELFQDALATMPMWETWSTTHKVDTGFRDAEGERIIKDVTRNHCKVIPRKTRRDMARIMGTRQWRERNNQ